MNKPMSSSEHSHISENIRYTHIGQPYKILIADEEPDTIDILNKALLQEGYQVEVVSNGSQLLDEVLRWQPDLILLEMTLAGQDTLERGRQIKEHASLSNTLLLFVTHSPSEANEISAFEIGADGYLAKPLRIRALLGRIRSMLHRRDNYFGEAKKVVLGNLTVEKMGQRVFKGKQEVAIAQREFELLFFLVQHPNQIFNREELIREVWGNNVYVLDRTVDVHIHKLREKLGEEYISTVKGLGYRLNFQAI
jgi:two-component system, OmpR family, alkaline phosphatase synthesis response regulator PhoP